MAPSSKPDSIFTLRLTRGGDAELLDPHQELVWSSIDDPAFELEFGDEFLEYDHVADILDYLEAQGELTRLDADLCAIHEEFMTAAEYAGLLQP